MNTAYQTLKLARELFGKAPETLADDERRRVAAIVTRQLEIERRILSTPEGGRVVVPPATLAARLGEIRARYASTAEYRRDLLDNGLDEALLATAVERDLRVEAVLERVAAEIAPPSAVDAEIYYRLHPEAFDRPEARRLRHILITFDDAAGRAAAVATLEQVRRTAADVPSFAAAALRHSQCPTAMDGGDLGVIRRGQLYAELETVAFALAAGRISAVAESPIGLHLLRCDEILPSGPLPFAEVSARIIEHLAERRRDKAQRAWLRTALS